MKKLLLILAITGFTAAALYAYSASAGGYVALPSASTSLPSGQVENRVDKNVPASMALSELRFSGSVAILEE